MPFGERSRERRDECDPQLIRFADAVMAGVDAGECPHVRDLTVLCGFRGEAEQEAAYNAKPQRSRKRWGESAHNSRPAKAIDMAPYPIDWHDARAWESLRTYAHGVARGLGIRVDSPIAWDLGHWELDE